MISRPASPLAGPRRILGIDPGLQVTGYAVLEVRTTGPHVCEAGVIRTPRGKSTTDLAQRLRCLYDGIVEVVNLYQPTEVAVEQLFAHYDHPRTAILMGHARGVILLAAAQQNLPVVTFSPGRVKKTITGHGRASKLQMQHAIERELRLARLPEPSDVADALAIALCRYHAQRLPG
ncbi:MAG: crossover junction endodeoxyribonuclease RuvC [Gemmataceae bacterium]